MENHPCECMDRFAHQQVVLLKELILRAELLLQPYVLLVATFLQAASGRSIVLQCFETSSLQHTAREF